jgi:hypothetical protein
MDHAHQTLRRLEIDRSDCESAHSEFRRAQKAYLNWVDDADGQPSCANPELTVNRDVRRKAHQDVPRAHVAH